MSDRFVSGFCQCEREVVNYEKHASKGKVAPKTMTDLINSAPFLVTLEFRLENKLVIATSRSQTLVFQFLNWSLLILCLVKSRLLLQPEYVDAYNNETVFCNQAKLEEKNCFISSYDICCHLQG